tara:strand:+ start:93 stop:569 length:477 start_codon:yes stop_codon:yes gene_type:complete
MLIGKKITLRSLKVSDLCFLQSIENNQDNWQFGSENRKFDIQDLLDYIRDASIDIEVAKQYRFVITLNTVPIGLIDLFDYTIVKAGVGVIIKKEYRNKGFAKEALELLILYSFKTLKINELYANIESRNISSLHLFQSCGFEFRSQESNLQYFSKLAD